MTLDLSHPSIAQAQFRANKEKKPFILITNQIGGIDIVPAETYAPDDVQIIAVINRTERVKKKVSKKHWYWLNIREFIRNGGAKNAPML